MSRVSLACCVVSALCLSCTKEPAPAPPACGPIATEAGLQKIELEVGGLERAATVHVPPAYDGKRKVPVVVALSHYGGTPEQLVEYTDIDEASESHGALLVLPEGIGHSWNAGRCCGEAWERGIDDVAFIDALLDEVSSRYCVDDAAIVVTGMSNGALMAHRLGCELSGRLRAIAPVAGPLHVDRCAPEAPIVVLQMHGTADDQMPYDGGEGMPPVPVAGDLTFSSIDASMARWRNALGCGAETVQTHASGEARCVAWRECPAEAHLELCTIGGGGHTWPGGSFPDALGPTSDDLAAGAYLLDVLLP